MTSPLAETFLRFARREATEDCPLYRRLAAGVAADPWLLDLADAIPPGPQPPNLLFAAVHFLLLGGTDHPLVAWYPELGGESAASDGDPVASFRAFCEEHETKVRALLRTRGVQTNEIGRCALLLPALETVRGRVARPLALVEVGASAGLNLAPERYRIDYEGLGTAGDRESPVLVRCAVRGTGRPPLASGDLGIVERIGLDLSPVDVRDPDARAWLRALVWPGDAERATRLQRALELAAAQPPRVEAAEALERLEDVVGSLPASAHVIVMQSFVQGQLGPAKSTRLDELVQALGTRRPVSRVSCESPRAFAADLELVESTGSWELEHLAVGHPHGKWIEWLR